MFEFQSQRFFSDMGGIMGLWLGCSLLSVWEVFELVANLVAVLVRKGKAKQEQRKKGDYI